MNNRAFEFTAIKFLNSGLEISASLEFDKTFAIVSTSLRVDHVELTSTSCEVFQILPTSIGLQASNLHAVNCSPWTRGLTFLRSKVVLPSRATGKLDGQSFSLEFGSMESWDDISRIHHVLVFDEAEAVHEFDFLDGSSAMAREMILDLLLGDISWQIPQIESSRRDGILRLRHDGLWLRRLSVDR